LPPFREKKWRKEEHRERKKEQTERKFPSNGLEGEKGGTINLVLSVRTKGEKRSSKKSSCFGRRRRRIERVRGGKNSVWKGKGEKKKESRCDGVWGINQKVFGHGKEILKLRLEPVGEKYQKKSMRGTGRGQRDNTLEGTSYE